MSRLIKICWLSVIIMINSIIVTGQLLPYKEYNVENGFPQSNVDHIFQDDKGFIWFATQNGAVKFNGFDYSIINVNSGLKSNIVRHINQDNEKNFWISTHSGLSKIDQNNNFKTFTVQDGLHSNSILGTYIFDNKLFICTSQGASILEGDSLTRLSSGIIPIQFLKTHLGKIVALSKTGIYEVTGHTLSGIYKNEKKLIPPFSYIIEDKDSIFWVCGEHGIFKIPDTDIIHFTEKDGLKSNNILRLLADENNNIWYGSEISGFGRYDHTAFYNFSSDMETIYKSILSLLKDKEGNIWIGSRSGVLMINTKIPFIHYNKISPLKNEIVMGMTIDKSENIWFCTYGNGIVKYNGIEYKNFDKEHKLIGSHFFDVEIDQNGNTWFATAYNGIVMYDGKKFTRINKPAGVNITDRIFTIYTDSKNNLWFGTNGQGALKYNGKEFLSYGDNIGFNNKRVMSICEDNENNIWFATTVDGLYKLQGNNLIRINKDSTNSDYVRCIENVKGTLWFGTASKGIFKIVEEKDSTYFKYVNEKNGLNSNNIYLIHYDSKGNLWVGSEKGVDKINFDENDQIISIKNYTADEGFIGVETNLNASLEDSNGDMWFGTINGAVKYNKDTDIKNTVENKTYITNIRLFFEDFDFSNYSSENDSTELPSDLKLPHNLNHLSFDFIGLCFSNPQKVEYKYRLIGQNDKWSPPSDDNKAIFTNIEAGEYEFQVISANNDNIWNETPISYKFTIEAPFWKENWFKTLTLLTIIILIYILVEFRSKSLKNATIKLENKVQERTSQLNDQKDKLETSKLKITDSINYAGRIQSAMLPIEEIFTKNFSEHFIIYKPRDIISGDFYWAREVENEDGCFIITVAADCTGHGIPGALVSMLGMSLLNEVIRKKEITRANQVLEELRIDVKRSLKQKSNIEENTEGIDMAVCVIDKDTNLLEYSGANMPLYHIRDQKLTVYRPTINPVGVFIKELPFKNNVFDLQKDDILYMFSDGIIDQFNGETGEKFKVKRYRELLLTISDKNLTEQKKILEEEFDSWKGENEQIDDVLVMGFKIK